MNQESKTDLAPSGLSEGRNPLMVGLFLCTLSGFAYTGFQLMLGLLAKPEANGGYGCDAVVINAVQGLAPILCLGPWLLWQAVHRPSSRHSARQLLPLLVLSLITQLGAVAWLMAISRSGVVVPTVISQGVVLAGAAVLGLWFLRERVQPRVWIAIGLITLSVSLFSLPDEGGGWNTTMLAVVLSVFSGIALAILAVGARKAVTSEISPVEVVFYISLMGIVLLGAMALGGWVDLTRQGALELVLMLAAGLFNMAGFFLLTKALQINSVARANSLTTLLSTVLTIVAGLLLFREPLTTAKIIGLALSVVSIYLFGFAEEPAAETAAATCSVGDN